MKSYLVQFRNGKPSLKFNGYINEDKEDDWSEPTLYPDELPDYMDDGDMVYFDKKGNLHLIDSRPVEEYEKTIKECMLHEPGEEKEAIAKKRLKMEMCYMMLYDYMEKPTLLKGKKEKEYIKWKKEKKQRELEEYLEEDEDEIDNKDE